MEDGYTADFERFWTAYPAGRKTGKGDAFKAWKVAIRKTKPDKIIAACEKYARSELGRSKYVKTPGPWLRARMFDDDPRDWSRSAGAGEMIKAPETNRIDRIILTLAEVFGRELSPLGVRGYRLALADLDPDEVSDAAVKLMRSSQYMPRPADLRAAILGDVNQHAAQAWITVCEAATTHGSYRAVNFADRTINAAIRSMGGWPSLLARVGKDFDVFGMQTFLKQYAALYDAPDSEDHRPLEGLGESDRATEPARIACSREAPHDPRAHISSADEPAAVLPGLRPQLEFRSFSAD